MMGYKRIAITLVGFSAALFSTLALADVTVTMALVNANGTGKSIGTVTASEADGGVLLTPNLKGLTPGIHGFHIHEHPDCSRMGEAAGSHLDPIQSGKHDGPYSSQGHLGDLPVLIVNKDGASTLPVLVPRISLETLKNHALIIHAGGDNYSDLPAKLGGGGARVACGVIK